MKKRYREIYFRGSRDQLNYLVEKLPEYAKNGWEHRVDSGILSEYLLFRYCEDEKQVAEVSIYCGDDQIKRGQVQVGNIVPIKTSSLSIDEYNDILIRFYREVLIPYKQENEVPYISEPTTDIYELHQVMNEKSYEALLRFLNAADMETEADLMDSFEEEAWHGFVLETFSDERELAEEDLMYAFTDQDFHNEIGRGVLTEKRAGLLARRYEIEYSMLIYYGKHVDNAIKWENF